MTTVQRRVTPAGGAPGADRLKWLPGLRTLLGYEAGWLPRDLVAGLVLTALLVPAGMGYAEASGLPPIHGLYATIVPLIAYALFGPSRILVLGPDSSLAPLIAASIIPLAAGDPEQAVALAGMLAVMAGVLCVAAGLLRFGFITDVLSKPVRYGYMNGIALTVLVGQLPKLFGFSVDADSLVEEVGGFVEGVGAGDTNRVALLIGILSLLVILGCKRWLPRIPGVLVAVGARPSPSPFWASVSGLTCRWWAPSPRGCRPSPCLSCRPAT
jgi:MFS superfamily sulfate permease-like transporter